MQFNPDPDKQGKLTYTNSKNFSNPPFNFSNTNITKRTHQKQLGIVLDSKLNFDSRFDQKIKKCDELVGLIRRLSVNPLRNAFLKYLNFLLDLIWTMATFYMVNQ